MIKTFSGVLAVTLAAAGLTACAGLSGGAPKSDMVMTQMSNSPASAQVLEESRCGMQQQLGLVGKNLNQAAPDVVNNARVLPAGAKLDQEEFKATRLTILFDARNNVITELRCG